MRGAYEIFKARNARYQAVAGFYLAAALHLLGDLDEASGLADNIKKLRPEDLLWHANSDILLSRIARSQYAKEGDLQQLSKALNLAKEAHAKASRGEHQLPLLDATIAAAEAQLDLGRKDEAKKGFRGAATVSRRLKNYKALGACVLHLARINISEVNMAGARLELNRWRALEPLVENGLLRSWATEIEKDLENLKADFRSGVFTSLR